jgi:hypothetical protein
MDGDDYDDDVDNFECPSFCPCYDSANTFPNSCNLAHAKQVQYNRFVAE